MGKISRLEAVNHMLLSAGEALVSDLADSSGVDTDLAQYLLDQVNRDYQLKGLANNRLVVEDVYPDANGKLWLRADTLTCDLISYHVNAKNRHILGVARGNPPFLWNVTDATDIWATELPYTLQYILEVSWDDMDTSVQRAVMASAARLYQITLQADEATDGFLAQKEFEALTQAQRQDIRARHETVFSMLSPRMRAALTRTFLYSDPQAYRRWR
jgi:hypothetical protein